jgi:hypothetical protein
MRKSEFLACEDIEGLGDVAVVIEKVLRVKDAAVQDGRKLDGYTIKFQGKDKMMVVNSTNAKVLTRAFGVDTKKWPGQSVKIYIQDGVRNPKGGTTRGLRVKVDSAKQNQSAAKNAEDNIIGKTKKE